MSDPHSLVLLRHGQSTWNFENIFTGWTDVPLSDEGEREAAAAAMQKANAMGGGAKANLRARRGVTTGAAARAAARPVTTVRREEGKVGRNDPCWCGSGKKYKKCHMGKDLEESSAQAPA